MNLIEELFEKGKLDFFELEQGEALKMKRKEPSTSQLKGTQGLWLWMFNTEGFDHLPYMNVLSDPERQRLKQLRSAKEFAIRSKSRVLLRAVLSLYTGIHASDLRFNYGDEGKPKLASEQHMPYAFNASHSGNTVVLMVGTVSSIGVDIERHLMAQAQIESVAQRFFHYSETAHLRKLPVDAIPGCFRKLWTYKEAWLKNKGLGVTSIFDAPEWNQWELFEKGKPFQTLKLPDVNGFQWETEAHCITGLYTMS